MDMLSFDRISDVRAALKFCLAVIIILVKEKNKKTKISTKLFNLLIDF